MSDPIPLLPPPPQSSHPFHTPGNEVPDFEICELWGKSQCSQNNDNHEEEGEGKPFIESTFSAPHVYGIN